MKEQKSILKHYMDLRNNPTLQEVSNETGIQVTRVFRILNGSKMKLEEYLIFKNIIDNGMGCNISLRDLVVECCNKLSINAIMEVENVIRRKIELNDLLRNSDRQTANLSVA